MNSELSEAVAMDQDRRFVDAAKRYQSLLSHEPEHAEELYASGVMQQECGQSVRAIELIERRGARARRNGKDPPVEWRLRGRGGLLPRGFANSAQLPRGRESSGASLSSHRSSRRRDLPVPGGVPTETNFWFGQE